MVNETKVSGFNIQKKNNMNGPEAKITILNRFDSKKAEKETLRRIGMLIMDISKLREFDCLFECPDKGFAKVLYQRLCINLGYHAENPYYSEDVWIIHAIKMIVHSELEETVRAARKIAAKYSCELIDWNFDVDIDPLKIN